MVLLVTVKFINENVYWHKIIKIFNLLNSFLREFPGLTLTIILMIYSCNIKTFLLLHELPQKIIPCFIIEWK
jgi:hypothetical protein